MFSFALVMSDRAGDMQWDHSVSPKDGGIKV